MKKWQQDDRCEACDSQDVDEITEGVFRCNVCGHYFESENDEPRIVPRRKPARWDDDDY